MPAPFFAAISLERMDLYDLNFLSSHRLVARSVDYVQGILREVLRRANFVRDGTPKSACSVVKRESYDPQWRLCKGLRFDYLHLACPLFFIRKRLGQPVSMIEGLRASRGEILQYPHHASVDMTVKPPLNWLGLCTCSSCQQCKV